MVDGLTPSSRTEQEIVSGILTVSVGGKPRSLRVLSMAEAREWKASLIGATSGVAGLRLDGAGDLAPVVDSVGDKMLDLVVAYDKEASLGGRDYLLTNGTDPEIYAIFRRLLEVSFPFVRDLRSALAELRAIGLSDLLAGRGLSGGSPLARSSSGDSANGVLASTGS